MYFLVGDLPFLSLFVPLGGGFLVVLLVLGVDSGLVTTHTLYPFVGMSFLLLSVAFVSFLTWELVLGWAGLD